jgi:hypothetical protein
MKFGTLTVAGRLRAGDGAEPGTRPAPPTACPETEILVRTHPTGRTGPDTCPEITWTLRAYFLRTWSPLVRVTRSGQTGPDNLIRTGPVKSGRVRSLSKLTGHELASSRLNVAGRSQVSGQTGESTKREVRGGPDTSGPDTFVGREPQADRSGPDTFGGAAPKAGVGSGHFPGRGPARSGLGCG